MPNIRRAFGDGVANIADGETLVFRPRGAAGAELVGRIRIEEWPRFAR